MLPVFACWLILSILLPLALNTFMVYYFPMWSTAF
jgi:hypothetical protein